MIAIIDYGVGNLFSLQSSLKFIGAEAKVTNNIEEIKAAGANVIVAGSAVFKAQDRAEMIAKLKA